MNYPTCQCTLHAGFKTARHPPGENGVPVTEGTCYPGLSPILIAAMIISVNGHDNGFKFDTIQLGIDRGITLGTLREGHWHIVQTDGATMTI